MIKLRQIKNCLYKLTTLIQIMFSQTKSIYNDTLLIGLHYMLYHPTDDILTHSCNAKQKLQSSLQHIHKQHFYFPFLFQEEFLIAMERGRKSYTFGICLAVLLILNILNLLFRGRSTRNLNAIRYIKITVKGTGTVDTGKHKQGGFRAHIGPKYNRT